MKARVESFVLWHDESGSAMGGCHAAVGRRSGHRIIRERIAPGLPMVPGKVERREFEYRRHGTQALIAAFDVTTGKVQGVVGNRRSEKDFARFFGNLLSSAAADTRWDIVCDN